MKSKARLLQRILIVSGCLALLYAGTATVYADLYQRYASWKWSGDASQRSAPPTSIHEGDLIGRLEVPGQNLQVMVLEGVEDDTLRLGAGHISTTPPPGSPGNSVIAAHRDSFFRNLKGIEPQDIVRMTTAAGTFEYTVTTTEVVSPDDLRVIANHGIDELTLITCYPFYYVGSAPKRFIVHAHLRNVSE